MSRIAIGTKVRTNDMLGSTRGIMVRHACMIERAPGKVGVIAGTVPNHYGSVYWVEHEGADDWAPYRESEFEVIQ